MSFLHKILSSDWPLTFKLKVLLKLLSTQWGQYPSRMNDEVEEALAQKFGVNKDNLLLTSGSTAFIELFFSKYVLPQGGYIEASRSYFRFQTLAKFFGVERYLFQIDGEGNYDINEIISLYCQHSNLPLVLCSPNNPTGMSIKNEDIEKIVQNTQSPILLDSAYAWFQDGFDMERIGHYLKYENVFQVYSLSKSFAAAGVRIGIVILNAHLKKQIKDVYNPFPLNHFACAFLEELLQPNWWNYRLSKIEESKKNRSKLSNILSEIEGLHLFPSQSNFITLKYPTSTESLVDKLMARKITAIPLGDFQLKIVSIGSWEQCILIIDTIKEDIYSNCFRKPDRQANPDT